MPGAYPNPDLIVRPVKGDPRFVPHVTLKSQAPGLPWHDHRAFIDRRGNGVTDTTASHYHRVVNRVVETVAGHTHKITSLRSG